MGRRLSLLLVLSALLFAGRGDATASEPTQRSTTSETVQRSTAGLGEGPSQRPHFGGYRRAKAQRCDLTATIDLQSQTQKRSFSGYVYEPVGRMVHTRKGLWSHLISARVSVTNVIEEPITFIFRWFDPDGAVVGRSEHVRPDRESREFRSGHWTLYPIVDELELKDRPFGKYTFVVESPEGNVLAERSFNYYLTDGKPGIVTRNRKTILFLVFGVVLACMGVVMGRVLR